MAEKSLKELRDEIAIKVFEHQLYAAFNAKQTVDLDAIKDFSSNAFKAAEAFLAARYDADKNGSRTT